jgi:hypothetical protein
MAGCGEAEYWTGWTCCPVADGIDAYCDVEDRWLTDKGATCGAGEPEYVEYLVDCGGKPAG